VRLVTNLLELSRLGAITDLALSPIDPLVVVEEAVATVILAAEDRQIDIQLCATSPQPRVLGDPDRLRQVLLNLLENAVKYSRPRDSIEVRLESERHQVICTVRDSGPGIAAEHLPFVQNRLYRVRTDVEGNGLGLSLVGEILRLHGSSLEIESSTEPGKSGTTVQFRLRLATADGILSEQSAA
jgi:signal transduction histidine kinase